MTDPIRAESIRSLYAHARTTFAAAVIITVYMVVTAGLYTPWPTIIGWALAAVASQMVREVLVRAFYRAAPPPEALERWARLFTAHGFLTGTVWGATIFLFVHPDEPITIALTLCCLYSIASGMVPAQAYNPPTLVALIVPMYAAILVRMLSVGSLAYTMIGITSVLYGVTMLGFCRVQARSIRDGFRIRFENDELVEALRIEKAEAEQARQAADAANLAKSQFLAAASHDLRQPLYALSLFCASLGTIKLDEGGRAVMNSIQDSVSTMESLFSGLLDVSRLDAGVVEARPAPVSIDLLFDRLRQVYDPIAIEQGLTLRFRPVDEWIESDIILLEQVLSNLLSNALRYTFRGGVLVAARRRAGEVRLEVWDTGRGIADVDRARIFDEFVQVENLERDRRKGLGLGLAIAQRSAILMGTRIEVRSRPLRGSCFSLGQPIARPPDRNTVLHGDDVVSRPTALVVRDDRPVLIVDDNQDIRLALGHLLDQWHVPFDTASDADEALHLIDQGRRYGRILVDFRLSGRLNGLDLIVAIRAKDAADSTLCSLITGDFDPALISAAKSHRVPVFHKPIKPELLRDILGIPEAMARDDLVQGPRSTSLIEAPSPKPSRAAMRSADLV